MVRVSPSSCAQEVDELTEVVNISAIVNSSSWRVRHVFIVVRLTEDHRLGFVAVTNVQRYDTTHLQQRTSCAHSTILSSLADLRDSLLCTAVSALHTTVRAEPEGDTARLDTLCAT